MSVSQEGRLFAGDADPQFALVLRRLRAGKGAALRVERRAHACSATQGGVCNPQCEAQLIAAGALAPPAVSRYVRASRAHTVYVSAR